MKMQLTTLILTTENTVQLNNQTNFRYLRLSSDKRSQGATKTINIDPP